MNKYHVLFNRTTLETSIALSDTQPENSILVDASNNKFRKSIFDQWPPTCVIEGLSSEEVSADINEQIAAIRKDYSEMLSETDWYELRFLTRQIPVPEDVAILRASLIEEANIKIASVSATGTVMKNSNTK